MNPKQLFCPNIDCPARGQTGHSHIRVHSQKEKRCLYVVWQELRRYQRDAVLSAAHDPQLVMRVIGDCAIGLWLSPASDYQSLCPR